MDDWTDGELLHVFAEMQAEQALKEIVTRYGLYGPVQFRPGLWARLAAVAGPHNKPMTWPIVEGRVFMRGFDGVYCYDLRKSRGK